MWCVVLQPKGTTRNAVIPAGSEQHTAALGGSILRRATAPEYIGSWKLNDLVVHLYAYKSGKAGTENKHELPPPHDTVLLFGEAVLFATKANKLVGFGTAEYTKFYNEIMGGFDEIGSEDSDTEAEDVEAEDAEEEVEEEVDDVEDVVSDESDDAESLIEEEDEEPAPLPVKIVKPKRANKKIPTWYNLPELTPEPYTLARNA
jgi:hypothetical protein